MGKAHTTFLFHILSHLPGPEMAPVKETSASPCLGQYGQFRDQNPRQEVVTCVANSVPLTSGGHGLTATKGTPPQGPFYPIGYSLRGKGIGDFWGVPLEKASWNRY